MHATAPWGDPDCETFVLQRCADCRSFQHPPGRLCSTCQHDAMAWEAAPTTASVVSWTSVHRAPSPEFEAAVPYTIVLLEIDDGPLVEMWLSPGEADAGVQIGDRVRVEVGEVSGRRMPVARLRR